MNLIVIFNQIYLRLVNIKMRSLKIKNKKAISELVSYVLLIVLALGLATGVYSWLNKYVPSANPSDECPETTALSLNDYNCTKSGEEKIIQLHLENKGYFNINGFFIKATNKTGNVLPTVSLADIPLTMTVGNIGRYQFAVPFGPAEKSQINFTYTQLVNITKIQIQPFVIGNKSKLIIPCKSPITLDIIKC